MRISNDKDEGFTGAGISGWHIDGAYKNEPFAFLIFHAVVAPKTGDTEFAGHNEVLNTLSDANYKMLDNLYSVNTRVVKGVSVKVVHPILYTHPITYARVNFFIPNAIQHDVLSNAKVMCIHLGYMEKVVHNYGIDNETLGTIEETIHIRDVITNAIKDNDLMYSHKWEKDDLVIIDNLSILHHASRESQFDPKDVGLRILHRVAVLGESKPVK